MHRRVVFSCCLALAVGLLTTASSGQGQQAVDLLITNARVMDGMGNPWVRASVAVRGDRIVAVGKLDGATASRVIDAHDQVLAPGFIDVHSHAGETLATETLRPAAPMIAQGVTTLVLNPDGGGPIDLASQPRGARAGRNRRQRRAPDRARERQARGDG